MKRRGIVLPGTALAVALLTACASQAPAANTSPTSPGELTLPAQPININVIDASGTKALFQPILDDFKKENPKLVGQFTVQSAAAPDLVGKLLAQQKANHLDIDLVFSGTDGIAAGLAQDVWYDLLGKQADQLPKVDGLYIPGADELQKLSKGAGLLFAYYPGGPLLEYNPAKVKDVPTTPAELLQWAKDNPNRFLYPRPANSGVGRAFLMGLPYLLGDKDPKDPVNGWEKTWNYLAELGKYIEYYPSGTGQMMTELAQGNRWLIPTTTGWDINPRAIGQVPPDMEVAPFQNMTWVGDGTFMAVPKGISSERLAVVLKIIKFALEPKQQAYTYDSGYLYPGPAVKGVSLDMAPEESQKVIKEFGRTMYADLIATRPLEVPLNSDAMVKAFDQWDRTIGSGKVKK